MRKPNSDPKKIGISMTLSPVSLEIIDGERGQISRSSFVDKIILERSGVEI